MDPLKRVTGTPDDDLRGLLVELPARGFTPETLRLEFTSKIVLWKIKVP
jgi:hypothetical protein